MRRRNFLGIFLVSVVIFSLSGCFKREKEAGKKLIEWTAYSSPEWNVRRKEMASGFEKLHPDVKVKFNPVAQKYHTKILTQVAGNTLPDIFIVPAGCEFEFVNKGILLDLTPYIEKDREYFNKFHPFLLEFMTSKGRVYGLPNNVGLYCVLYYNKDIFDKEGLSYPKKDCTWDEFLEIAKKLTKIDERGKVIQFGCTEPNMWALINSFGGRLWNEAKIKCIFNSPEVVKAIQFLKDLSKKYRVAPTHVDYEQRSAIQMFLAGKTAMFLGGSFTQEVFYTRGGIKFGWGVVPMPMVKKGMREPQLIGYLRIGVSSRTKYPDEAAELVKYILSTENIIDPGIKWGDSLPIRKGGEEYDYYMNKYPLSRGEKEILWHLLISNPRSYYNFFGHPYVPLMLTEKVLWENLDKFTLLNKWTAEETAKNIEDELNRLIIDYAK